MRGWVSRNRYRLSWMSYLTYMYGRSNAQCRYDYCEYVKANSHVCYIEIQLLVICCRSLIPRNKVLDRTLHLLKLFLIEWTSCWYRKEAICNFLKLERFHVLIECPVLFTSCRSYPEQSLKEVYVWTVTIGRISRWWWCCFVCHQGLVKKLVPVTLCRGLSGA